MDRKLIVTLLRNHIEELEMMTEGFIEMTEYPKPLINLARKKTEDILDYISQLESIKSEVSDTIPEEKELILNPVIIPEVAETIEDEKVNIVIETVTTETREETINVIDNTIQPVEEYTEEEKTEWTNDQENGFESDEEDYDENELVEETTKELQEELLSAETEIVEEDEEENEDELEVEETPVEVTLTVKEEKVTFHNIEIEKNTVADSHNNKKIDDIRQAISIGDRFRFQRELFNGNGEVLNKTLSYLNQLNDFDEARTYLTNKFKWNEEDENVESFYQIIKRRYL